METVIGFVAVQAQLSAASQANPVGACAFAAAFAGVRIKQPCLFRQGDGRILHVEHILRVTGLVVIKRLLPGHALGLWFQNQPDGRAGVAVVERKGLFAPHMKQQVAFADAAAQNHRNRIHAAGIIFRDAHNLLILGKASGVSPAAQL